jgi:hypothetical protein
MWGSHFETSTDSTHCRVEGSADDGHAFCILRFFACVQKLAFHNFHFQQGGKGDGGGSFAGGDFSHRWGFFFLMHKLKVLSKHHEGAFLKIDPITL